MIKALAYRLRKYQELDKVFPITGAKVPIVQFVHAPSGLEVNICLYNTLVEHNTRLLKTYSLIDPRVRELGYAIKYLAKTKGIADASKGGLSPYAYLLMAIYYLQQCNPPVVPVLQELYPEGETKPEVMVEGWNVWFFEDIGRLKQVWSEFGQNKQSVGELWLGMLRFYTRGEFSFKRRVVAIRQKAPLTRLQKEWNCRCVAIEDPFKLDHNVGNSLIRKMKGAIMKAFSDELATHCNKLFGKATPELPGACPADMSAPPNLSELTDKQPPGDGGCGQQDKIGYNVEDFPELQATSPDQREDSVQHGKNPDTTNTTAGIAYSDVAKKALGQHQSQKRRLGTVLKRLPTRPPVNQQPRGGLPDSQPHLLPCQNQQQQPEQLGQSKQPKQPKQPQQPPKQPQSVLPKGPHRGFAAEVPPPKPPGDMAPPVVQAQVQDVPQDMNRAGLHNQVEGAKLGPRSAPPPGFYAPPMWPPLILEANSQAPPHPGCYGQQLVNVPTPRHMPLPPNVLPNGQDIELHFGGCLVQQPPHQKLFCYGPPPKPAFRTASSARQQSFAGLISSVGGGEPTPSMTF